MATLRANYHPTHRIQTRDLANQPRGSIDLLQVSPPRRSLPHMGLLIGNKLVDVPGLNIIPPASHGGPPWALLGPDDHRMRPTQWVRQIMLHSTTGNWPQPVKPGAGKPGHAQQVAEMWSGQDRDGGEKVHSGAHIIVDYDGSIACLCDLQYHMAYHAEASNPWSIGIEMSTYADGSIQDATLSSTARLVAALTWSGQPECGLFSIPFQGPRGPYRNRPLRSMETGTGANRHQVGGPLIVGVVGHRDNTSNRGYGDPGNEIWTRLLALGMEGVDYDGNEDAVLAARRQKTLNDKYGAGVAVDGVCGPASLAAMRKAGISRWRDIV